MSEPDPHRPKRNWLGLVVTSLLGIAATVAVGWYQVLQAEKQAVRAEEERARAVRQDLVALVEEPVLNERPIDIPRLARLVDQRRREERVTTPITVAEVLENAEYNIFRSRYLAFEKKQAIKVVFDTLYSDLSTRNFAPYSSNTPNANLLNALARLIQDGKSSEALQTLRRLEEAQTGDSQRARLVADHSPQDFMTVLLKDPWPLLAMLLVAPLLFFAVRTVSEQFSRIDRRITRRLSLAEARSRVISYRQRGVPDDVTVELLIARGVPRGWISKQLAKVRPTETDSSETPGPETETNS